MSVSDRRGALAPGSACGVPRNDDHSTLMFAARAVSVHLRISVEMSGLKLPALPPAGEMPCAASLAITSGSRSARFTSALMRSITALGVPGGGEQAHPLNRFEAREALLCHGRQVGQLRIAREAAGGDHAQRAGLDLRHRDERGESR